MRNTAFIGILLVALMGSAMPASAEESVPPKKDGLRFFYLIGRWMDNFCLNGVDTNYITLPEHSWRVAFTNSEVGIRARYTRIDPYGNDYTLKATTMPSIELGFNIGYRGFGFGYAWDVKSAYARNMNISFGSKLAGIEFSRQRSTNIIGETLVNGSPALAPKFQPGDLWITNTNIAVWLALNSEHYSHNAAIKQSYIQRMTAGSLLLNFAYFSSIIQSRAFTTDATHPVTLLHDYDDATEMWSQQLAVGIGYGINYTPNKGKVILHASANAQLVVYSLNHVSFLLADSIDLPGYPRYLLHPSSPVYVTGNMRAAVSWEINRWVHLNACVTAQNLRFKAAEANIADIRLNNWNWHANIAIGVRLGAGRERVEKVLAYKQLPERLNNEHVQRAPSRLPQWITRFFFSPR